MIIVYRDNQFEKCLDYLKRAGGSGLFAARRAESLIEELAHSDGRTAPETCRLTRNGEARIRRCRKYDLGDGYRLVCIRKGRHLVLLYAGSHDDCDRWLEHNRGLRPVFSPEQSFPLPADRRRTTQHPPEQDLEPADEDDAGLATRLTEKELRRFFSALCER
jgi:hypothetical protein